MTTNDHDERLIAYLLDELPEADAIRVEEEYLACDENIELLEAVESELYDAYALAALSPERSRTFEKKFLVTAEQRARLDFARALLSCPPQQPVRVPRPLRVRTIGVIVLAAAALILLAVSLWRPATNKQPAQEAVQPSVPQPVIAPLTLAGGITRNGGEEPTLDLPPTADVARITATVGSGFRPPYRARLQKPEGAVVWTSDPDKSPIPETIGSVVVDIPAPVMENGHYILTISATNANGAVEDAEDYAFLVRGR